MAKGLNQIQVDVRFNADTEAAKRQIDDLKNSLSQLTKNTGLNDKSLGFNKELQESIQLATKLQSQLQMATNVNTGKLDLGKFNDSLKKSGISLKQYQQALYNLGPQGAQAFSQLATSIMSAEAPMKRINESLNQVFNSLKNTARWQISSSVLHGFMGAVQKAYGYAQDLNESLNNIRIVTGQNIDQMAEFANQASKAAKALSTTTTQYTDASLIYYQQGLNESEVKERTDITIKMANVARESAQVVSDQMTAVWNNFDDGSKSLEYYADVMTALGAATASSTDEIAQGLEKFSAIASTVGLSYEYATSALATVTAETRQSADVVGTAFKTLFARIEGLQLGKTLEDGTDLNKYSQALATVGVQIKDTSGEMRSMDNILSDLGARWQTLAQDEKIALAQTVAGVRQYNQLIALMDNWDVMQENLGTAYSSSGALQEQADIYAESWEASRNRVKAAAEDVYDSLLDEKFFIALNDGLAKTLGIVTKLIDSLGGMPGVLSAIAVLVTKIFSKQITSSLDNLIYDIKLMSKTGQKELQKLREESNELLISGNIDQDTTSSKAAAVAYTAQGTSQQLILDISEKLTQEQRVQAELLLNNQRVISDKLILDGQELELEEKKTAALENQLAVKIRLQANTYAGEDSKKQADAMTAQDNINFYEDRLKRITAIYYELSTFDIGTAGLDKQSQEGQRLLEILQGLANEEGQYSSSDYGNKGAEGLQNLRQALEENQLTTEVLENNLINLDRVSNNAFTKLIDNLKALGYSEKDATDIAEKLKQQYQSLGVKTADVTEGQIKLNNSVKNFKNFTKTAEKSTNTLGANITTLGSAIAKSAMVLNNFKSLVKTLKSDDLSFGEKLTQSFMSISMILPGTIGLLGDYSKVYSSLKGVFGPLISSQRAYNALLESEQGQSIINIATKRLMRSEDKERTAAIIAEMMVKKGLITEEQKEAVISALVVKAKSAENEEQMKNMVISTMTSNTLKGVIAQKWAELGVTAMNTKENSKNIIVKKLGAAADKMAALFGITLTASKTTETGAVVANTAAWYANPIMWIALVIVAVIAAVALLVVGIVALTEAINKDKKAIEEAEAAEKRAAENAKRVAEEINNIAESLNNIDKNTKALEDLDRNSQEWYKTLTDINREVQEIIGIYPELLAMGMITKDLSTGALGITEEGKEYINQQNTQKLIEANNISLRAQQRTAKAKYDATINKFGSYSYSDSQNFSGNQIERIVAYYNSYGEELYADAALQKQLYENMFNATPSDEEFSKFTDGLKDYKEFIKENNEYLNEIVDYHDQILQNYAAAVGSNRSAEQLKDLMGSDYSAYSVTGSGNSATLHYGNNKSFNMNKHVNYDENDADWATVQEFMDMQGDNVEYVAQRHGKMVLKIDGTEVKFSEQEIYDALGEAHALEKFEADLEAKLTEELGSILDIEDIEALELNDLVDLDNLGLGIKAAFGEDEVDEANAAFAKIVSAYGDTKEELEELAADTAFVDYNDANFKRLVSDTSLTADQLQEKIKELNAIGNINASGEWFAQQAEQFGLDSAAAETMQGYALHLMQAADSSEYLADSIDISADSAKALSVQIVRMNKGIEDLAQGFEEWSDILKNSDEVSLEYYETLNKVQEALGNIFDINGSLISGNFIETHLAELEKVAQGDVEAIESVRKKLQEEVAINIALGQTEQWKEDFNTAFDEIQGLIADKQLELDDLQVGAVYQDQGLLEALNEMITESQLTADQVNDILSTMNFTPVYNQEEIENGMEMPNGSTKMIVESIGLDGGELIDLGPLGSINLPTVTYKTESIPAEPTTSDAKMRLTSFSGGTTPPTIQGLVKKDTGANNNYSASNAGGKTSSGGSKSSYKSKKAKVTKKSEIVERYKEITDSIDDVSDAMERANKQADHLYGASRLAAMRQSLKLLEKERDLLEEQVKQAKEFYSIDQGNLIGAGAEAGLSFEFDNKGNITNYTEQMENLYHQKRRIQNQYNAATDEDTQTRIQEEKLDPLEEKIEAVQEAMEQYEETRELLEDLNMQIQDNLYAEMDAKLEIIEYEIELNIQINDDALQYIDFLMGTIEDSAFNTAKKMALLGQQTEHLLDQNATYAKGINDILANHGLTMNDIANKSAEELSQAGFTDAEIQSLRDYTSSLQDNTLALLENQSAIQEQVIETHKQWNEEFAKTIEIIEYGTSVLDHYNNIINIVGKGISNINNQIMEDLAQGQIDTATASLQAVQNQYEATENAVQKAREEVAKAEAELAQNPESESVRKNLEFWQNSQFEIEANLRELDSQRQSSLETVLEAVMNKYQVMCNNIITEFEKGMSKVGKTITELQEDMSRRSTIDERYIDDYEKIYNLNKMSRELERSLNNTVNLKSQALYREQIEKINQLKTSGVELSEHDLQILQKEIELTQAKIGIEEAASAKTQVIRRRDTEGNWGYVYAAQEDGIIDAVQTYEDKVFEIQELNQDYLDSVSELVLSTEQEWAETIQGITEDLTLTTEEKAQKIQQINSFYTDQIDYLYMELNKTIDSNTNHYENDIDFRKVKGDEFVKAYGSQVSTIMSNNLDLQLNFTDTRIAQITEFETMEEAQNQLTISAETMGQDIVSATQNMEFQCESALNELGLSLEETGGNYTSLKDHIYSEVNNKENGIVAQTQKIAEETDQMQEDMQEDFNAVTTFLDTWNETYAEKIGTAVQTTRLLSGAVGLLVGVLKELNNINFDNFDDPEGGGKGTPPPGSDQQRDTSTDDKPDDEEEKPKTSYTITEFGTYDTAGYAAVKLSNGRWYTSRAVGNRTSADSEKGDVVTSVLGGFDSYLDPDRINIHSSYTTTTGKSAPKDMFGGTNKSAPSDKVLYSTGVSTSLAQAKKNSGYTFVTDDNKEFVQVDGNWYKVDDLKKTEKIIKRQGQNVKTGTYTYTLKKGQQIYTKYFDTGGYTGSWGPEGRMAMLHQKELVLNAQDTENFLLATNVLRDIVSKIELTSLNSLISHNLNVQTQASGLNAGIEQNVVIHAEFPDATNHSEIEEAFNNLLNRASQFANRK